MDALQASERTVGDKVLELDALLSQNLKQHEDFKAEGNVKILSDIND